MWFVYVLVCQDNSLYTGISKNPEQRFLDHKNGRGGKYTGAHRPIQIVYLEKVTDKSTALKRELEIKGWSRPRKVAELGLEL